MTHRLLSSTVSRLRRLIPQRPVVRLATAFAFTTLFVATAWWKLGPKNARIEFDSDSQGQALTGWEVTARAWEMDKANNRYDGSWKDYRDEILPRLVGELGVNRIRIEVRSGVENPIDYWSQFMRGEISYEEVKSHFYEKINDDTDPKHLNAAGFQWSSLDDQVESEIQAAVQFAEESPEPGMDELFKDIYVE